MVLEGVERLFEESTSNPTPPKGGFDEGLCYTTVGPHGFHRASQGFWMKAQVSILVPSPGIPQPKIVQDLFKEVNKEPLKP